MRLQGKLPLLLAPLLLIPVASTAWIAYRLLAGQSIEHTRQLAQGLLGQEVTRFEQLRQEARASLRLLAVNPVVGQYLLTADAELRYHLMQPSLLALLATFQEIHPYYDEIRVLLPDGYEDVRSTRGLLTNATEDEHESAFFRLWRGLAPDEASAAILPNPDTGGLALILGCKVELRNRAVEEVNSRPRLRGYLGITIGLDHFAAGLHGRGFGRQGRLLITDRAGVEQLTGPGATPPMTLPDFLPTPTKNKDPTFTRLHDGSMAVYWTRALAEDLFLVALLPHSELFSAIPALALGVGAISLVALLALFLGMYWILQRQVIGPLTLLGEATRAIADGRLGHPRLGESGDEIGRLAQAFRDMQASLIRSREAVEAYQRELEDKVEQAQAATQAKSAFLAKMSHEIRTPMNGVLGMTELLLRTPLSERQAHYLHIVEQSARHLLEVINDILDFSKVEAGRLVLAQEPFDLSDVLDEIATLFEGIAGPKGLVFHLVSAPDLPCRLIGDRTRLRQILINLLGNAVKFTERGTVCLAVEPAQWADAEVILLFRVRDTGLGLTTGQAARIFDSFTQSDDSAARRYGGTGLGLTIARQLVQLMQGEIGVESMPGEGSEFWFTAHFGLKVADPVASAAPGGEAEVVEGGRAAPLRPYLRVLVVEDNPVNQLVAEEMLLQLECVVETATDGAAALARIEQRIFDLVLMDGEMPGMDGYQATRELRRREHLANRPHLPVIAVTANAYVTDRERSAAAGMDDHLSKPFDLDGLRAVLRRWTGPRRDPDPDLSRSE